MKRERRAKEDPFPSFLKLIKREYIVFLLVKLLYRNIYNFVFSNKHCTTQS